jgi:hypothetical protein
MSKHPSAEARSRSGSDVEVRPVERRTPRRRSLDDGTVRNGDFASAWASGRTMSAGRRPVAGPRRPVAAPQRHVVAPQRQVVAPQRHWPAQCRSIRAHARRSLPILRGRAQGCRPDGLTGMGAVGRPSALMGRPPTRRTCRPDPCVPATTEPSCGSTWTARGRNRRGSTPAARTSSCRRTASRWISAGRTTTSTGPAAAATRGPGPPSRRECPPGTPWNTPTRCAAAAIRNSNASTVMNPITRRDRGGRERRTRTPPFASSVTASFRPRRSASLTRTTRPAATGRAA